MAFFDIAVYGLLAIALAFAAAVVIIFGLSVLYQSWVPVKGGHPLGLMTIYGVGGESHTILKGFWHDVTHIYEYEVGTMQQLQDRRNDLADEILSLKNDLGDPTSEEAGQRIQFLLPYVKALNHATAFADQTRLIVGHTFAGAICYLLQHTHIAEIGEYATTSRSAVPEFVIQVPGFWTPRIVAAHMIEIPHAKTQHYKRISDLPTKGRWFMIDPVDWSEEMPTTPPPSELVVEALVSNTKISRLMSQEPVIHRQMREVQRGAATAGATTAALSAQQTQMMSGLRKWNPELGLSQFAGAVSLNNNQIIAMLLGTILGSATGLYFGGSIAAVIGPPMGCLGGYLAGNKLQERA